MIIDPDPETDDVKAFNRKFGMMINARPRMLTMRKMRERIAFLQEELKELSDAAMAGDMAEVLDALVDLVYVAKGCAVMMGLPWAEAWDLVHAANMAKVPGPTKRRNRIDATKPPGWTPPDHEALLAAAGYNPNEVAVDDPSPPCDCDAADHDGFHRANCSSHG